MDAGSTIWFSLELTCGSSRVHADAWALGDGFHHPKHLEVVAWAGAAQIMCSLSGTTDHEERFSDCYLRFPAERIREIADGLRNLGWTGDILDVYDGNPTAEDLRKAMEVAHQEGWQLERGFEAVRRS